MKERELHAGDTAVDPKHWEDFIRNSLMVIEGVRSEKMDYKFEMELK